MLGLKIASVVKSENLHTLALTWFITAFTVLKQLLILRLIKRQTNCEFKVSYCECNNNYSKGQTPFNPTVSVSKHFELLKNKVTVTKSAVLSEKGLARTRRLSLSLLKLILAFSSLNILMCLSPCVNIHLIMPLRMRMCDVTDISQQNLVFPKRQVFAFSLQVLLCFHVFLTQILKNKMLKQKTFV